MLPIADLSDLFSLSLEDQKQLVCEDLTLESFDFEIEDCSTLLNSFTDLDMSQFS